MFTPEYAVDYTKLSSSRLFLGLQGAPGTGKTTSALTFPNVHVLDIDRNLGGQLGKSVTATPIGDDKFCREVLKAQTENKTLNRRDAIKYWIRDVASKFSAEQTLVVSSWTTLQHAFDIMTEAQPSYTEKGAIDKFAFWRRKIEYSRDILDLLKGLSCHVVVEFHETFERDENGSLTSKSKPLMQGSFMDQIKVPFSDFYRQVVLSNKDRTGKPVTINGGVALPQEINYLWQIKSDNLFDAKCHLQGRTETYVPANYNSIK